MSAVISRRTWSGLTQHRLSSIRSLVTATAFDIASVGRASSERNRRKAARVTYNVPARFNNRRRCEHAAALFNHDLGHTPSAEHSKEDLRFMLLAIAEAELAAQQQEVPVGAVLVLGDQVISSAHNQTEQTGNPTAHAEMLCIQEAAAKLGGWRLLDSTLYVTLEPCPMCAGALLQSRVGTVVYGAKNSLLGADGSWIALLPRQSGNKSSDTRPHRPHPFHDSMQVRSGIMADECSSILKQFFKLRRQQRSQFIEMSAQQTASNAQT